MAFMIPVAERFTVEEAREYVYEPAIADGSDPDGPEAGWYGRLSAPGYMDCTEWQGPFDTAEAAIASVMETFDVDENGDDVDDAL